MFVADTMRALKMLPLPLQKREKYAALCLLGAFFFHLSFGNVPEKTECFKCFGRVNLGRGIPAPGSESKLAGV